MYACDKRIREGKRIENKRKQKNFWGNFVGQLGVSVIQTLYSVDVDTDGWPICQNMMYNDCVIMY